MGNKEVKYKLEIGDYKNECKGPVDSMIDLAIDNLRNYKKVVNGDYSKY